jgi:hypothetical protein
MKNNLRLFKPERTAPKREVILGELSGAEVILRIPESVYQETTRASRLSGHPALHFLRIHAKRIMDRSPEQQSGEESDRAGRHG